MCNLTDEWGNIVQTYYYDAFGKSTNVKHDPTNKKQFTGKEVDEDSGLQYFGARYYDAEVGRFISQDPSQDGINYYAYCYSNPINKVDPDGREPITATIMTVASGIAVVGGLGEGIANLAFAMYENKSAVECATEFFTGVGAGTVSTFTGEMVLVRTGSFAAAVVATNVTDQVVREGIAVGQGKGTKSLAQNAQEVEVNTVASLATAGLLKGGGKIVEKAVGKGVGRPAQEGIKKMAKKATSQVTKSTSKKLVKNSAEVAVSTVVGDTSNKVIEEQK